MMLTLGFVAAVLAAVSVWLIQPPRAIALTRLGLTLPPRRASGVGAALAVTIAAVCVWTVVGGWLGLLGAIAVGLWVRRWVNSIPPAAQVARDRRREAGLPVAVDLLAACLASGAPTLRTLQVVSASVEPSLGHDLRRVAAAMEVGGIPDEAWSLVSNTDLAAVTAIMRRSAVSGAPAATRLGDLAVELRARLRTRALSDARALGVRTAGPLGVCFLPAFILIGVVPLIASLVQQWL